MKKAILSFAIVAIAAVAAFNMNFNLGENKNLSALALANIEALAEAEIKAGDPCYNNVRYDVTYPSVVVCGTPCFYQKSVLLGTGRSKCE